MWPTLSRKCHTLPVHPGLQMPSIRLSLSPYTPTQGQQNLAEPHKIIWKETKHELSGSNETPSVYKPGLSP